eukprot:TRINITY_DN10461_c0_g1_i1.p1 TRINITY_DN10461_c0_g1~~TRINITY_DN10461_c0_g1_i1.p1  ORF type:complete len:151 (-),score=26.61 TRINITY_DN10461_c0_g1_i1:28-480(-)
MGNSLFSDEDEIHGTKVTPTVTLQLLDQKPTLTNVRIQVTITNNDPDRPLKLYRWNDGDVYLTSHMMEGWTIEGPCEVGTRRKVERGEPNFTNDYRIIEPGKTLTKKTNLAEAYKFSYGKYLIRYKVANYRGTCGEARGIKMKLKPPKDK